MLVLRMAFDTSDRAVKGGQTTMSTSFMLLNSRLRPSTKSRDSATVLFIFQLPAIISLRSLSMRINSLGTFLRQCGHSRQNSAFQEFQARSAAGAQKSHSVPQPGVMQRLHAVAAADNALGAMLLRRLDDRLGDGIGAGGKTRVFEHAHRAVPKDGL